MWRGDETLQRYSKQNLHTMNSSDLIFEHLAADHTAWHHAVSMGVCNFEKMLHSWKHSARYRNNMVVNTTRQWLCGQCGKHCSSQTGLWIHAKIPCYKLWLLKSPSKSGWLDKRNICEGLQFSEHQQTASISHIRFSYSELTFLARNT